jgi:hypothetical protein
VTSSLLGLNILPSTLFSDTYSLCASLNVRDQISYSYKTGGTITENVHFTLYVFDRWQGNKIFWTEFRKLHNFFIFLNTILICHCATSSIISGYYITILSCTLVTGHEYAFSLFKMLTNNMGSLSP